MILIYFFGLREEINIQSTFLIRRDYIPDYCREYGIREYGIVNDMIEYEIRSKKN